MYAYLFMSTERGGFAVKRPSYFSGDALESLFRYRLFGLRLLWFSSFSPGKYWDGSLN